jgi:hypothetical protein
LHAINLMEPQPKKRISPLPQIAKAMTTTSLRTIGGHSKTTEEKMLISQKVSGNCKPWSNGRELHQRKVSGCVFPRRLWVIIATLETIN